MRVARVLAVLAAATIGCSAIIGAKDIYFDADAGAGIPDASSSGSSGSSGSSSGSSGSSSGSSGTSGGTDGGGDANTCNADLQTSAQNCGRCGHDCQGGTCTLGKCDAVLLAGSLAAPVGITVDATNVVFHDDERRQGQLRPESGRNGEGSRDRANQCLGCPGGGTTLYWSNRDFILRRRDVQGRRLEVHPPGVRHAHARRRGDFAMNVQLANGKVYFAAQNDATIRVALPDAGAAVVADTNQPFGLGVDATYAYYTSSQPNLYRARLDDAGTESVGPLNADLVGYVAVDATRFYWTYTETGSGAGARTAP